MTVRELMDICARHENLDEEVRIEYPHPKGGLQAGGVVSADNDPMSGFFFIEVGWK